MANLESQEWFNTTKEEQRVWSSNPSFILHLPHLLFGLLIALVGIVAPIYLYFFTEWPEVIAYLLVVLFPGGLIYTAWRMLTFKNKFFVITNKNVIMKEGIFGYDKSSKPHREIVRVDTDVSPKQKFLSMVTSEDIGQIIVRTADDSGKEFVMKDVPEVTLAEQHIQRFCGTDIGRNSQQINQDITGGSVNNGEPAPASDTGHTGQQSTQQPPRTEDDFEPPANNNSDTVDVDDEDGFEQYEPSDKA